MLKDRLETNGYDIVHLNFDESTDYMQNSAYLVQKAIKELKAHSEREEDIVIIGLSSGGVIAKYALADWEKRFSEDHEVRLNVAFDAGFDGNNVPVGAQYMIQHLNDMRVSGINLHFLFPTLLDIKKLIETPAARQMLSVHYRNDISLNQSFFNELNNLGNPKLCRNVSISNGDRIDDRPNLTPDQFIINKDRGVFEIVLPGLSEGFLLDIPTWGLFSRTLVQIKSLHNSNQSTNVYEGRYWSVNPFLFIYLISGRDRYHSAKASYSTSAGGLFFSPDNVWTSFLRQVTFVPTASALDVMNHQNPQIYQNIYSPTYNICETPFDSWYTAPSNEAHVEWNDGNSEFLWNEIQSYNQPCQEKMCDDVYISGSSKVCGTQTYSIVNRPANSSIYWTSSSNITITSGNGTNTISINKNGSGTGYVSARVVKSGCGTARIRKDVTIPSGSNSSISISGPTSGYENNVLNYTLSSISRGSSYTMTVRKYSGGCYSNCWTIYTNSSRQLSLAFISPGTYQITGSVYNGCRTVTTYKYVTVSSSGGGGGGCSATLQREGSNPSSGDMTYKVIEPIEPCDTYRTTVLNNSTVIKDRYSSKRTYYSVIDARGFQVLQGELHKGSFALDMKKYPKGLYIVNVYWKGQLMTDRLIRE
ncbi:hypothetical protein [Marivirga harenae]|uniref:hypothetical protein n=2 Tax=Marivirga TaxID=869806 RepID=UPI0026E0D87F|nr:hypothetical protein [Marivirga harenae]WKV12300.1 hypothetical protein Q3Y49_00415 [Marivirga harenae]